MSANSSPTAGSIPEQATGTSTLNSESTEQPPTKTSVDQQRPAKDTNGEHLLETPWTFWYDHKLPKSPTTPQNYADHLRKLGTFSTIEGFFRCAILFFSDCN